MVIARKPALVVEPQRKTSLKRAQSENAVQNNNNANNKNSTIATNDFKCLRSNDMRYSDYAVTSSTTTNQNNKLPKLSIPTTTVAATANITKPATAPPTVVVSIPRFPLSSGYDKDELFENVTLAQLKTASSKNTTTTTTNINQNNNKVENNNLPRLKIELNSLKTKITLPKTSIHEAAFEQNFEDIEMGLKTHKVRKRNFDEVEQSTEVDLETYVKNIGLKPIDSNNTVKYSPNASPHSSTSNSSNSTSVDFEYTASAHKKRKKKHHSKEGNGSSKKRKLHAEISSQNADESLKMKVKITAAHSHRGHHKVTTAPLLLQVAEKKPIEHMKVELEKPTTNGEEKVEKEEKAIIPASPPLPPSLFKTVPPPLTLTTTELPPPARKTEMGVSNAATSVPTPTTKPASPKLITTTVTTTTQKTFAVPALPTRPAAAVAAALTGSSTPLRKFTASTPTTIASKQQQQLQKLQKKTNFKQIVEERQVMEALSHNFKLPKLPNIKSSSATSIPTFDNRPLYTPMASAALSDFTKRLASNTLTITSRPKVSSGNKFDFTNLQKQQNSQLKATLDFMRGKAAALNLAAAARAAKNAKEEAGNRTATTLMGPPLSTIMKSPKKMSNTKMSALSYNMSPHVPLSIASLAAVAAAAGNVNSATTTIPHGVRSPPLPLTTALAAAKNKSPYRQTPPALINLYSPVNIMFPPIVRDLKFSSNNKSSALDLSGNNAKLNATCNTLEAHLNKFKPNIMSCTVTTAERELAGTTTTTNTTTTSPTDNNLKTLAKEREKLASMYEKTKLLQQSPAAMVRPQNASVRNIPNPSALAFRNQPAKSAIKSPPPTTATTPPPPTVAAAAANTNSNNQSPPLRATKKPTTIDQVAANLNIRAAAAALSAAATITTTTATVTVKSSTEESGIADTTTTTASSNGETTKKTATTSPVLKTEKQQETSKSAIVENVTTTTTTTTTTATTKPASNFKSIAENSCSSPGPTTVTSIKLEKIAVE